MGEKKMCIYFYTLLIYEYIYLRKFLFVYIMLYLLVYLFMHRVLRRIFGPKRDEVTGELRRLHNEELYALYSSPNIIRVIKSRRQRWAGLVASMGERRGAYRAIFEVTWAF
jgi:hypothetical protein